MNLSNCPAAPPDRLRVGTPAPNPASSSSSTTSSRRTAGHRLGVELGRLLGGVSLSSFGNTRIARCGGGEPVRRNINNGLPPGLVPRYAPAVPCAVDPRWRSETAPFLRPFLRPLLAHHRAGVRSVRCRLQLDQAFASHRHPGGGHLCDAQ